MSHDFSHSIKSQVCFVKSVKHGFRVGLKCSCEERVEIGLIRLVDARDSDRAAIAGGAGSRSGTTVLVSAAVILDGISCCCTNFQFIVSFPVLESCMIGRKVGNPLTGMGDNLLVHTVLEIFLLVGIEEQIKTGQVAEGGVF